MKIIFSKSFEKSFKKRIKPFPDKEEVFYQKLEIFIQDPFHPSLRTHKLSGKLKEFWSFSILYDLRVIFQFIDENTIFIDIGTHDEVY